MARALWRGLLAIILLSSLCSVPVLATTDLTVNAALDYDMVDPGMEVVVTGSVRDDKWRMATGADIGIVVENTTISANTIASDGTFIASLFAPLTVGIYSVNVSAVWDDAGTNYSGYSIILLEVLPPPPPAPDISIDSKDISFWAVDYVTNSTVWVNATVRNIGEVGANTTVKIFWGEPFDGKMLSEENITVPANGSHDINVTWVAKSGMHLFTVVASHMNPSDNDFTNNQANNSLEIEDVLPPVISEPMISPDEPTSLDFLTVLVSVEDDLGLAKDCPITLIFAVSGGKEEESPMNETKDGFFGEIGPFPGGTFILMKIRAVDMFNNSAETGWYRRDIYYLSMSVHVEDMAVKSGMNLSVACSAEYDDGTSVTAQEAILVIAGNNYTSMTDDFGVATFNITAPSEPGKYPVTVFVSDKRLVANSSAVLTVLPIYPDVSIVQGGIVFSWVNASEVEVTVILCNSGDAPGDVHLDIFHGSPSKGLLLSDSNFTLKPGQFHYHSFFWSPEPGHHALVAIANCPEDVAPGNNIASAEVTIPVPEIVDDDIDDNDTIDGDDLPDGEIDDPGWTLDRVILSLGIGLFFSIIVIGILSKYMDVRGKE
ncbi:MAG: hypothetical protein R6W91_07525 [Thermoplasmata archaeon]